MNEKLKAALENLKAVNQKFKSEKQHICDEICELSDEVKSAPVTGEVELKTERGSLIYTSGNPISVRLAEQTPYKEQPLQRCSVEVQEYFYDFLPQFVELIAKHVGR